MSFREKIAWASFATTVLVWGTFFVMIFGPLGYHAPAMMQLVMFAAAAVAQAVLMTAVSIIWAVGRPEDAHAPQDERDRAIGRRASGVAYLVVVLAVVGVIVWLHFGLHGRMTIFALAAALLLAEAARFGAQAIGYRVGG